MSDRKKKLRTVARRKLKEGEVGCFVGYQQPINNLFSPPLIAESLNDLERLTVNPLSVGNLSLYLPDLTGKENNQKVGVVVKGCDSRTLNVLLQEDVLKRENLFIVGLPCKGILDPSKLRGFCREEEMSTEEFLTADFSWGGDKVVGHLEEKEFEIPKEDNLLPKCRDCDYPNPIDCDVRLGSEVEPGEKNFARVEEIEDFSLEERWEYWERMFDRCIRCYACRSICPLCYCESCKVDPRDIPITEDTTPEEKANRPEWIEKVPNLSSNLFFHILRIVHTAGRCVGCGECERACPMDIPLTELSQKLEKEVRKFDYVPGLDAEGDQFLTDYKEEE